MNVLIVRLSAMGDILHALPLARNAARAGHRVGWVVERRFASLLRGNPDIAELIETDSRRIRRDWFFGGGLPALAALRDSLRRFSADAVLDPQGNEKSFWVSALCGAPRIVLEIGRAHV